MGIKIPAALFLSGLLFQSVSARSIHTGGYGTYQVGMVKREFYDSTRSNWLGNGLRPLRIDIWYPADPNSGTEETINEPEQFRDPVGIRTGGSLSRQKHAYPLIVISHGSYGNSNQMRWLAYYLASNGFIAVAVNHNGNPAEEKQTGLMSMSEFCMWERPVDISVTIDKILADKDFKSGIDRDKIGVAGFSLGGATAIWTGGAILNMDSLKTNAPKLPEEMMQMINRQIDMVKDDRLVQQSRLRAENSFLDKRIKAIFALAPAIGFGFTREGLKGIDVPVQIVVGDQDVITPMSVNAQRYARYIKNAKLIVLPGERGHYTQKSQGNQHALQFEEVSSIALKFFQEVLK